MTQGINEQVRPFASVEPKRHFVKIGRKMLRRDFMPRSHDAALEQRESGLDSIRVGFTNYIDTLAMLDRAVPRTANSLFVSSEIIADDDIDILADILSNIASKRTGLDIF